MDDGGGRSPPTRRRESLSPLRKQDDSSPPRKRHSSRSRSPVYERRRERSRSRDRDARRDRPRDNSRERRGGRDDYRGDDRRRRSPPRREGNSSSLTSGRRLYVAGFAFAVKEDELQEKFEEFGRVSSVSIVKRPDGESRGFGFVVYDDERDADKAVRALDRTTWYGRRLAVEVSTGRGAR